MQRLIVAQINSTADAYSGAVDYSVAPWFDWGPYLWANGNNVSPSTGLFWCNGQGGTPCVGALDFRYGDLTRSAYWGDYTHPTANAVQKVAGQLVDFIGGTSGVTGSPWVTPWIGK